MRCAPRGSSKFKAISLIGLFLILFTLPLSANLLHPEAGLPPTRYFSAFEYRGHPQVFSAIQASNGYLYFSNAMGMLEFDGIRWRHHPAPVTFIYSILEDHTGRIWIGGRDSFGFYEAQPDGSWRYQSAIDLLPEADRKIGYAGPLKLIGETIFATTRRGLVRIKEGSARLWPATDENGGGFITTINDTLYWMDSGRTLQRLEGDNLTVVAKLESEQARAKTFGVPRHDLPPLWVIGREGVFITDEKSHTFQRVAGALDQLVATTGVNDAILLDEDTFAVATTNQGLIISSQDGQRIRSLKRDSGLPDNAVLGLTLDRAGGLWAGLNAGVSRISYRSPVTLYNQFNGPTPGTIDNWFRHEGKLYAATADGLYRLESPDYTHGTSARFQRIVDDVSSVHALNEIEGHLVFAGSGSNIYRLESDGSRSIIGTHSLESAKHIYHSGKIDNRYYVIGTTGLSIYDLVNGKLVTRVEYTDIGTCFYALEESNGDLWVASYATGFWRIPQAHLITDWSQDPREHYFRDHGLPNNMVWTTVTPGNRGTIFFTDAGGYKFDASTRRFSPDDRYPVDGENFALSPTITTPDHNTWGSAFGDSMVNARHPLVRFAPDGKSVAPVPLEAISAVGLSGIGVMAVDHTDAQSTLWLRGYEDHIRLDLDRTVNQTTAWQITIKTIQQADRVIALKPHDARALDFDYSSAPLVITFSNPDYSRLNDLKFQSRLLGFDDQWSAPSTIPQISYTNLEGGPFTLEVRGLDSSGQPSDVTRITFSVVPPWYRRHAAYVIYALIGIGFFYAFTRWRLRASERERERLEQLVQRRTDELAGAKEVAETANRAKSTFLANMSHELRTPLNGVLGYARIMLRDKLLPRLNHEHARIIADSGEHLLKMINEVLDFSKIEAGKVELRPAPYHLPSLLRDIEIAFTPRAQERHLEFTVIRDPRLPEQCLGDAQKLRQVIDNLLSNAFKFTKQGRVELEVDYLDQTTGRVAFTVSDTGVGLGPEELSNLFTPFYQPAEGRPPEPGTGLGLSICQRLVQLMGGKINVQSTPGQGSRFTFELIIETVHPGSLVQKSEAVQIVGYAGDRKKILVVDDIEVNRCLLRDLLVPLGFEVALFPDATSVLAHLNQAPFDAAILDLRMPDIDGLELTRRIRARALSPRPAIILTSASVLSFDPKVAIAAGCDDFLAKPFHEDDLTAIIGKLLSLSWITQALESASPADHSQVETFPSSAEIAPLMIAAQRGAIGELRRLITQLKADRPDCTVFTHKLESMVAGYEMERVRNYLETCDSTNSRS